MRVGPQNAEWVHVQHAIARRIQRTHEVFENVVKAVVAAPHGVTLVIVHVSERGRERALIGVAAIVARRVCDEVDHAVGARDPLLQVVVYVPDRHCKQAKGVVRRREILGIVVAQKEYQVPFISYLVGPLLMIQAKVGEGFQFFFYVETEWQK
jgi:hypothetical protein